jgi:signal transduction histidine kinase
MKTGEASGIPASRFRTRLLAAMMVVVVPIALVSLYFAERQLVADEERKLELTFRTEIEKWRGEREMRETGLFVRTRALIRSPKLHAVLEPSDGAGNRLYDDAHEEMSTVLLNPGAGAEEPGLRSEFYRFLDPAGRIVPIPPRTTDPRRRFGVLTPEEEHRLEIPHVPTSQQIGYLVYRGEEGPEKLVEVVARPIPSLDIDFDDIIGVLVVGFETPPLVATPETGILRGVWLGDRLFGPSIPEETRLALENEFKRVATDRRADGSAVVDGVTHRIFWEQLNPGSLYPPAFEVAAYPLTALESRRRMLRWQVAGAGVLLLLGAFGASSYLSGRLARVVTDLAEASAEDRAQRHRAEAELELRQEDLARAARFSADASHQLKTPVTVLRAGLEELAHREGITAATAEEISALVRQTGRLSGIIEDLLLLSRIDAGRLALVLGPVNLTELFAGALDDVGVLPGAETIVIENELPVGLNVLGERRYLALVVQNLMENAAKYNRPGGRIRVAAREAGDMVEVTVENTGRPIPADVQARIFERFNRGSVGENVPGYGLGLNLARELARLHGGDLRLVGSNESGTRFEVRLRRAPGTV